MDEERQETEAKATEAPDVPECSPRARFWLRVAWAGAGYVPFALVALVLPLGWLVTGARPSFWPVYDALFDDPMSGCLLCGFVWLLEWFCLRQVGRLQRVTGQTRVEERILRPWSALCFWGMLWMAWEVAIYVVQMYLGRYPSRPPDLWWALRIVGSVPMLAAGALLAARSRHREATREPRSDDASATDL